MKKIISLISSVAMILSVSSFATVASAAEAEAFVKVLEQTDTSITLGVGVNTTDEYFKSIQIYAEIPEEVLDTANDVYANRADSKAMYIASNPTNKAFKFNPNIFAEKYEAFGAITGGANYNKDNDCFVYSAAIGDGAMIPADGIMVEVTLPLAAPIAADTELSIMACQFISTDFETDVRYGIGDPSIIGNAIDVQMTAAGDVLKGAAPAEDITVDTTVYELTPSPSNPETKTVGFKATVNKAAQYVKLAFDGAKAPVVIDFGVSIDATKTFGLNIMKVPAGTSIAAPTAEIIDALSGEAGTDYILAR